MAVLFVSGTFMIGADNSVYAQDNSGYYGSGYGDASNGGGTLGSGTRTGDSGTTGNGGSAGAEEDNGLIGSGAGRIALVSSSDNRATAFFQSIWNFFF